MANIRMLYLEIHPVPECCGFENYQVDIGRNANAEYGGGEGKEIEPF